MYSPKIKSSYIPVLYLLAKSFKKPMTKLVNEIIHKAINEVNITESDIEQFPELKSLIEKAGV